MGLSVNGDSFYYLVFVLDKVAVMVYNYCEGISVSELAKTVLILDDESFVRQSFADYFEDHLWNVLEAESGEQALELLKSESPTCAIVDVRLSGIDGNEFISRATKVRPKMVFIVCIGFSEYDVSDELDKLSVVSGNLFRKPMMDISQVEKELLLLMGKQAKKGDNG